MDNVVREELWEVDYPLTLGNLRPVSKGSFGKREPHEEPYNLTIKQGLALLLSGRPNEKQSDHCISLLVSPRLCGTSPTCWDIMASKDEEIHGYALTHRLLYLQVARQVRGLEAVGVHMQPLIADTHSLFQSYHAATSYFFYKLINSHHVKNISNKGYVW
jgi:hypothetical protein